MRLLNLNTVLCVGSGLTLDPQRLAGSGLEVDAMDFSKFAMDVMREIDLTDEFLDRICEDELRKEGGICRFVEGNLFDHSVCPGPYDVVLERSTVQTLGSRRREGVQSLQGRVSKDGYLISQWHNVPEAGEWLRNLGYGVVRANSAEEALEGMAELQEQDLRGARPIWLFRTSG
ncbi:MAG: hypothetical protein ACK2T3_14675 [Candidatus Promineifilaceae bacterium]